MEQQRYYQVLYVIVVWSNLQSSNMCMWGGEYVKSLVHDSGIKVENLTCHWINRLKKVTITTPLKDQIHKIQEVVNVITGHILFFIKKKTTLLRLYTFRLYSPDGTTANVYTSLLEWCQIENIINECWPP